MLISWGTRFCRNLMGLKLPVEVMVLRRSSPVFLGQIYRKEALKVNGGPLVPIVTRQFRTSPPRHVHPLVILLMKPLIRGAAMISGRVFRAWWHKLPKEKKHQFFTNIWKNKPRLAVILGGFGGLLGFYYYEHLSETPITKRLRFLAITPSQFYKISDAIFQEQLEEFRGQLLPKTHHKTQRVARVANQLLNSNMDIEEIHDKTWAVTVVDSPIRNAFVLPNGQIFVFSGMLDVCLNDDQLAGILAHEISHCILSHGAEHISFAHFLDWLLVVFIAAIWAFLPSNTLAAITHWLFEKVTILFFHLPYNRKLENEADTVGLILSAKALELRTSLRCPRLKDADPRQEVAIFKETVEKYLQEKWKEKANEHVVLLLKKPGS